MHFSNEFLFLSRTWSRILDTRFQHSLPRWQHNVWKYPGGPINCGMPKQHKIDVSAFMHDHTLSGLKQHTFIICGSKSDMGQMELKWKCWQSCIPSWRFWGRIHFSPLASSYFWRLAFLARETLSPTSKPAMSSLSRALSSHINFWTKCGNVLTFKNSSD